MLLPKLIRRKAVYRKLLGNINDCVKEIFLYFTTWWFYSSESILLQQISPEESYVRISTLKSLGGQFDSPYSFSNNVFLKKRWNPGYFVTFSIIISHIFPENFIVIPQVVQKMWTFSLTISTHFSDFLTFPCYKETKDVSI